MVTAPPQRKKIAIATLGCKVNQFESAAFVSELDMRPEVALVDFTEPADVYIVNTCAVTSRAAAQSRQLIRRALRLNPEARLVVTGCYAQIAPLDIIDLGESPVCIVGNGYKHRLVQVALAEGGCDLEMHMGDIGRQREICPLTVTRFGERTRACLKVQDGCDSFCSYCIVPHARGRSRSLAPELVLRQARIFAEQGYREMVLTGIHLGYYGRDLTPPASLAGLLAGLLGLELPARYRLSSLEPTEISDELLDLMAGHAAVMPCLHIPLQSGDDRILARMNRRYPAALFAEVVENCLRHLPDAAIGVDVLVGFPGEDEAAFQNTFRLLEGLPIASLHVFPYSKRPGTPAAAMADQVPKPVKEERVALLRELDHKKREAFASRHLGSVRRVLVEAPRGGRLRGFSDNYIPVEFAGDPGLVNQLVSVRLEAIGKGVVLGRMVGDGEG
ncbi:MAG: tRNA (N(6)-L-threonylcarbamoyladenosine(37)-C(2))-methylthiotransferase MtaB [Thermodesulfobacteriota bacterium]